MTQRSPTRLYGEGKLLSLEMERSAPQAGTEAAFALGVMGCGRANARHYYLWLVKEEHQVVPRTPYFS